MNKNLPFDKKLIAEIAQKWPTPFYLYDEQGIREYAQKLKNSFSWVEGSGYKNYFAVKACPNPHLIKILKEEGMRVDCSSLTELILVEKVGFQGEEIMFTSNNTPTEWFKKARDLGAIINFDDLSHLDFYQKKIGNLPDLICFRYNPGPLKEGNEIIGNPVEAKYGMTKEQLFAGYRRAKELGVKRFGLHTMIVSNMLDLDYLVDTAKMIFSLVKEIQVELGIEIEFVNLGGGLGVAYRPEEKEVDLKKMGSEIEKLHREIIIANNLKPLKIFTENGRAITGPFGYLISRVRHLSQKYKTYVGLDASMNNLMRPALYGAYHHITILGKENEPATEKYDITGALCENNDKFAIDRPLPKIEIGDLVVIHDAGAHGHAMGFQYNGLLRSAELLLTTSVKVKEIRRAENIDDYFATLDFEDLIS